MKQFLNNINRLKNEKTNISLFINSIVDRV